MKAAKCAWFFVARQTGALRYTEVGGVDRGGDDLDGGGVGDGGGPLVVMLVVLVMLTIMTMLMFSMVLSGRANTCQALQPDRKPTGNIPGLASTRSPVHPWRSSNA